MIPTASCYVSRVPPSAAACECRHLSGAILTSGIASSTIIFMDTEMSQYRLWCYVAGDFTYFSIEIDSSECLDDLRELILDKRKSLLSDVYVDGLTLFQVCCQRSE